LAGYATGENDTKHDTHSNSANVTNHPQNSPVAALAGLAPQTPHGTPQIEILNSGVYINFSMSSNFSMSISGAYINFSMSLLPAQT